MVVMVMMMRRALDVMVVVLGLTWATLRQARLSPADGCRVARGWLCIVLELVMVMVVMVTVQ
jgi:hypothetical protein